MLDNQAGRRGWKVIMERDVEEDREDKGGRRGQEKMGKIESVTGRRRGGRRTVKECE